MTLTQIEYIREIQKGRGEEDHGIRMLTKDSMERMEREAKYWVQVIVEL